MMTKVKNRESGLITLYRSQQYEIGTYLIINDDPSKQVGLSCTEEELHDKIRSDKKLLVLEKY